MNGEISEKILNIRDHLGDPAYVSLQPVVCNIRNCAPNGTDLQVRDVGDGWGRKTGAFQVSIGAGQHMWVVDGQHRRAGFQRLLEFLNKVTQTYKYPAKGLFVPSGYNNNDLIDHLTHNFWSNVLALALTKSTIAIECHLGLKQEEEQQLFYDLNSKVWNVKQSLAFQYDHNDPVNKLIAEEIVDTNLLGFTPSEKDVSDWQKDDGAISRKDINTVTCLLALGKTNSKSSTPALIEARREYIIKFWKIISKVNGFGKLNAKSNTVLAQPVVLKALAKLGFDLAYGHQNIRDEQGYAKLLDSIISGELDFSHSNKIWQALLRSNTEREEALPGISEYVHVPPDTNLDAGVFDEEKQWIRFGSRHNDIFPRLGDTIRYTLKLKPRPSVTKAIEDLQKVDT